MKITFNGEVMDTPSPEMTVMELLEWRGGKLQGTAVAVNDKIVPRSKWQDTKIKEDDRIVMISAAFGG